MTDPSACSPGTLAEIACRAEVMAFKAGNVHPGADFADTTWQDFLLSAAVCVPALDSVAHVGVGAAILAAVRATRAAVGKNTNLGMLLLLAPLCAAAVDQEIATGVRRVLANLMEADARDTFEAIRLANPGGLGTVERADVRGLATVGLVEAMALAAPRDAVARQYANGFKDVLETVAPRLAGACVKGMALERAIVFVHLQQMAGEPDSLIRRKCGDAVAVESSERARAVLAASWPDSREGLLLFDELDGWLRADGNRRNPGTSADLIAAGLFVALRREPSLIRGNR